ncbi:MAG: CpsD/CapB family tyrosine-protein kinase [Phycisphaeraceae bacterium]
MGDVFDAMKRSRRARGEPEPTDPAQAPAGPEQPALPIDQVPLPDPQDDQPHGGSLSALPIADRTAVSRATEKSRAETQQSRAQDAAARLGATAPVGTGAAGAPAASGNREKLNGYAEDVVVHHDRGSAITEQYRALRTQILARARNRRLQTHVITSAAPEEGKTVTTINLGFAFAELRNQRTLLVEGDLRRPGFYTYFHRDCTPGLLQLLRGELDDIDKAIHRTVYDNLQFMPAGGRESTQSTELLTSDRMTQILDKLKDRYDHIFIDTPPVVTVTDGAILGAQCDQALMVVRLNKTPSEVVERAKRLLRAANVDIAGVILTHLQPELARYRYVYRYAYGASGGPPTTSSKQAARE